MPPIRASQITFLGVDMHNMPLLTERRLNFSELYRAPYNRIKLQNTLAYFSAAVVL